MKAAVRAICRSGAAHGLALAGLAPIVAESGGEAALAIAALARAFAGTPLADPSASIDDAALAWHLATQAALRRAEPDGLAAVIHHVLRRRAEARRLRRAAWRLALGGAP